MQSKDFGVNQLLAETLDALKPIVPAEGRCLAFWHSPDYPRQRYCTLLFTNLWVLRVRADGCPEVFRVPGTVWRDRDGMQRVLYSSHKLVRIRGGPRNNMVVLPERLGLDERAIPAVLYRRLRYEQRSITIHERRLDQQLLLTLKEGLQRETPEHTSFLRSPEFYCRNQGTWRPRINGLAASLLADCDGYDPDRPYLDNLKELLPQFTVVEPGIRDGTLYPMNLIMGRGSVYADLKRAYGLYDLPWEALANDEEVFRLEMKENP